MNRRSFLQGIALMFAAEAADKVIPLGRVWSFPKTILIPRPEISTADIMRIGGLLKCTYGAMGGSHYEFPIKVPKVGILRLNGGWPTGSLTRADFV